MDESNLIHKMISIGISEKKTNAAVKHKSHSKIFSSAFEFLEKQKTNLADLPKGAGMLIYHLCTKIKTQLLGHLDLLTSLIASHKLDSTVRVDCALEFILKQVENNNNFELTELEKYCADEILNKLQIEELTSEILDKFSKKQLKAKLLEATRKHKTVSRK